MALTFGVPWLCALLFWGCVCFPPQKGYNVAHGYSFNDDKFSAVHAGTHDPRTSNQFYSGAPSNTNHDSVSPTDEMQAVSLQRAHYENQGDVSPVASLGEEMVQSETDSGHVPDEFLVDSPAPSVQISKHERHGYQQPFGLLMKQRPPKNTVEGVSFPTIKDLRLFIETMKKSFLTPGSDVSRYFQTAQQIMDNELASNAQNTGRETGYRSDPAEEESAPDGARENGVWGEPMNAVFEQNEPASNYQTPSESLSVPEPFDSTASLISTSVYDSQDSGPDSALYPRHHLAATEHYGDFATGDISGENPDIFPSTPKVRNEDVQSPSYMIPDQITDDSSPVNSPVRYYSSEVSNTAPLTSENEIQQLPYTSHGTDSLTGYQKPSGGTESVADFQSEEHGRTTPDNALSAPQPRSLNVYAKSFYVPSPRSLLRIPDFLSQKRKKPAPSIQVHQPTIGKDSKDPPTDHLPVTTDAVSSGSLPPQSSSGPVGVQTSSLHDIPVKLSSSVHGSTKQDRDRANNEITHLAKQNLVSAIQEPKQMLDDNPITPISGDVDPAHSGTSPQVGVGYESFNSLNHLTPASHGAFPTLVGNEIMSGNFVIKNVIPNRFPTGDLRSARKPLSSFLTPQRRGIGGFVSAMRAAFPQTFIQHSKAQRLPANLNKELRNVAHRPPKSKSSGSTLGGVFWRTGGKTKRPPLQTGSTRSLYSYVAKSRNHYVRGKVSLSKTRYTPYRPDEGKTGEDQWKPAPRQYDYKNDVANNVKGFEE